MGKIIDRVQARSNAAQVKATVEAEYQMELELTRRWIAQTQEKLIREAQRRSTAASPPRPCPPGSTG
jgi:hypothetical protein